MTDYEVVDLGGMEVTETTPVVAGPRGRSAYEVAVTAGFSGTELEWLDSLQGVDGDDGLDGASAYEVAVANGFVGTEAEWLASLAAGGGGGLVDSVNGQVGVVVLDAAAVGAETPTGAQAKVDTHAADTTDVHGITDTAALATTADVSSASTADRARANHTGTQSADTLTDGVTNKAFLAAERTKLAGVAAGATANDTDVNLKNRANHTGTQAASTITGLGDAAAKNTGTTTGTVAAGDDSRITGAAQKSANLSDLANAGTARTNLSLGTAATKNTGTASGDVPLLSTGGVLPIARLATGTPDGTKFVRDDGTLVTPAGGGGELAYAEITSTFSTTSATDVAVPGMTITVTVGTRPVWIEAAFPYVTVTGGSNGTATMSLYQGATQIGFTGSQVPLTGGAAGGPRLRRRIPAGSGTLTFSVQVAGSASMTKAFQAAANNPAYITANEV